MTIFSFSTSSYAGAEREPTQNHKMLSMESIVVIPVPVDYNEFPIAIFESVFELSSILIPVEVYGRSLAVL